MGVEAIILTVSGLEVNGPKRTIQAVTNTCLVENSPPPGLRFFPGKWYPSHGQGLTPTNWDLGNPYTGIGCKVLFSIAVAVVSVVAETVSCFGQLLTSVPTISQWDLTSVPHKQELCSV